MPLAVMVMSLAPVTAAIVADVMLERAQAVAREHGIANAFADYRDLLKLDLDAVDICTPNRVHTPAALAALSLGRHVLCEKPLTGSLAELVRAGEIRGHASGEAHADVA